MLSKTPFISSHSLVDGDEWLLWMFDVHFGVWVYRKYLVFSMDYQIFTRKMGYRRETVTIFKFYCTATMK